VFESREGTLVVIRKDPEMQRLMRTAIVTGASGGIGAEISKKLSEQGWKVFGTTRGPNNANDLMITVDLKNESSVAGCVSRVVEITGRLDALVNNAGASLTGAVEETTVEEGKELFEANFWGVHRMTIHCLPHLRKSNGRIVTIGSVAGFLPKPFEAFYSASKHALQGYCESLDHEIRSQGVRSILIEPGFVKTNLATNTQMTAKRLELYRQLSKKASTLLEKDIQKGISPREIAEVVWSAIKSSNPPALILAGSEARNLKFFRSFLPASFFDWQLRKRFGFFG
jgi:short-subunit dehydrogenase